MDHFYDGTFSERGNHDIEEEKYSKTDEHFGKVRFVHEIKGDLDESILLLKNTNVGKCDLIDENQK
jgi:hypothetical protein